MRASFSLSALQAHRSLQAAFRSEPAPQLVPGQPPPQLLSARCALFLIWRAIARSMLQPVWECPPLYRRRFEVAAVRFALDATRLDGRTLRWGDFGGLDSYLHLLDFCIAHARQTTGSAAEDAATAAAPPDLQEFLAAQSYAPEVAWELSELLAGETPAETPAPPAPALPDAPALPPAPATPPVLQALREAGGPVDLLAEGRAQIYPPTPPPSPAIEPDPAANPDNTPPPTVAETPATPTIPPPAAVATPGTHPNPDAATDANAAATAPRPPRGKRAGDQNRPLHRRLLRYRPRMPGAGGRAVRRLCGVVPPVGPPPGQPAQLRLAAQRPGPPAPPPGERPPLVGGPHPGRLNRQLRPAGPEGIISRNSPLEIA